MMLVGGGCAVVGALSVLTAVLPVLKGGEPHLPFLVVGIAFLVGSVAMARRAKKSPNG
jgi:hypothetical protein